MERRRGGDASALRLWHDGWARALLLLALETSACSEPRREASASTLLSSSASASTLASSSASASTLVSASRSAAVIAPSARPAPPSTEAACVAAKGRWEGTVRGRGRLTGCSLPTSDVGKPCSDGRDCESTCVDGKCWGFSQYKGCGILVDGKPMCAE